MMGLIVICLLGFAVIVLVYGIIRNATIDNHYANIILCAALNMLGPVTIMFILASVIFK
jgi:accessory gene regulator protein AgrB